MPCPHLFRGVPYVAGSILFLFALGVAGCSEEGTPLDDAFDWNGQEDPFADEPLDPQEVGTVVLSAEAIGGPGSILVYHGQETSGQVEVPANALVGVVRDGQAYLYHPALGNTELSVFNSRRAVGYFIDGLAAGTATAAKSVGQPASREVDALPTKQNLTLSTGVRAYAYDANHVTIRNSTGRWIAAMSTQDGPLFLPPRDDAPLAADLISLFGQVINGRMTTLPQADFAKPPLRIHAGIVRALPAIWLLQADSLVQFMPERLKPIVALPPGYQSPMNQAELAVEWEMLKAKSAEAMADYDLLFVHVNMVDFGHFVLEAMKSVAGFLPEECAEVIIRGLVLNVTQATWVGLLTLDAGLFLDFVTEVFKDVPSSLALCGAQFTPFAPASLVLSNLLDILYAMAWISDWRKGQDDVFRYTACDLVRFEDRTEPYTWGLINLMNVSAHFTNSAGDDYWSKASFDWYGYGQYEVGSSRCVFRGSWHRPQDPAEGGWTSSGDLRITLEAGTLKVLDFYGYEKNSDPSDPSRWEVFTITGMPGGNLQLLADTRDGGPVAIRTVNGAAVCGLVNVLTNEWQSWGNFTGHLKDSEIRCSDETGVSGTSSLTLSLEYRPPE